MTGKFITLEGGEGVGKSTLARALAAKLEDRNIDAVITREPGGSPGADAIRELFVRGGENKFTPRADALLIAAARADHVARTIRPALGAGRWVICDRFTDSTRAYQGAGRGLGQSFLSDLERAAEAPTPDLTFVLDLDPEHGVARSKGVQKGEDRFERMDLAFHRRIRDAFLAIAAAEPQRCVVIDATMEKPDVAAAAWRALCERLGLGT